MARMDFRTTALEHSPLPWLNDLEKRVLPGVLSMEAGVAFQLVAGFEMSKSIPILGVAKESIHFAPRSV